jgi:alpha-amylase
VFSRQFLKDDYKDVVVVGLDLNVGEKEINVSAVFKNGDLLHDAYSDQAIEVVGGKAIFSSAFNLVLLEKK